MRDFLENKASILGNRTIDSRPFYKFESFLFFLPHVLKLAFGTSDLRSNGSKTSRFYEWCMVH